VSKSKTARTDALADSVTVIGLLFPVTSPSHPTNTQSAHGVAVRVSGTALSNVPSHVPPQFIPDDEVTVPVPSPIFITRIEKFGGGPADNVHPIIAVTKRISAPGIELHFFKNEMRLSFIFFIS
jgi:hypothetical protein